MTDQNDIQSEHIKQRYIQLLEESNVDLHRKTNPFSLKNILVYSGLFMLIFVLTLVIYRQNVSIDIFEDHLVATNYNNKQILIQTAQGVFYQVSKNTNKKWMADNGVFVTVNDEILSLTTTKPLQKNGITNYTIWIPKNKTYKVITPDGTKIFLNSNSKLRFSNSRSTSKTHAVLEGEAFFEVAHNPNLPYKIKASKLKVEVFGTTFNINNKPDDTTSLALVKGSVSVRKKNTTPLYIKPGEEVTLKDDQLVVKSADFSKILSWTSKHLYFANESLESIVKKIGAWYNVEFVFKNPSLKKIHFTGNSNKENGLIHFLQKLEYTEGIQYTINNNKILLYKKVLNSNN